jgi:hypothetical protein
MTPARQRQPPAITKRVIGREDCPDNGIMQFESAIIGASNPDEICQATHEYALGQRPLFGRAGRLLIDADQRLEGLSAGRLRMSRCTDGLGRRADHDRRLRAHLGMYQVRRRLLSSSDGGWAGPGCLLVQRPASQAG